MANLGTKAPGEQHFSAEYNQVSTEFSNLINSTLQTPSSTTLNQITRALAIYAGGGDFYTEGGAADAYILSLPDSKLAPLTYFTGMRIRFVPANTNTGASTVNVASLGVKNIKSSDTTSDPYEGQIKASQEIEMFYDGTNFVIYQSYVSPYFDKINYPVNSQTALGTSVTDIGQIEILEGTARVWPKELLLNGTVFITIYFTGTGTAALTGTVRILDDSLVTVWERTMAVENPGNNEMHTYTFDLSTGNTTDLDLTTTDVAGINLGTILNDSVIDAVMSVPAGTPRIEAVEFTWQRKG